MVERRDDLDLVYECPAGRYLYPTTLVRGQAKASCYKPARRKEKKNLKSPRGPSYPVVCGGESQGRDLSRFFSLPLSLSLSKSCTQGTPYLTVPYLTLPMLPMLPMLTYRNKKHPQKTTSPKQQLDAVAVAVVGGGEPTNRVLKVLWFLPSTWVGFSKKNTMHDSIYLSTYL